jgi:hypothetical protein
MMPTLLCMIILSGARRSREGGSLLVIHCRRCGAHALAAEDGNATVVPAIHGKRSAPE